MEDEVDRDQILDGLTYARNWLEAEKFAKSVEELWQRAESLTRLATALINAGKIDDAKRVLGDATACAREGELGENLQDSLDSSSVLTDIARILMRIGDTHEAQGVAEQIRNQYLRKRTLDNMAQLALETL